MKPRIRKFKGGRDMYGVFIGDAYVLGTSAFRAVSAWRWYEVYLSAGSVQLMRTWQWDIE